MGGGFHHDERRLSTMSGLKQYVDHTGRLPQDALLGYIAFSLGADGEHDRELLVKEFERLQLDPKCIPPLSRAVDAFKKAIRGKQEFKYDLATDTEARIQFREVASSNPMEITLRAIMRETRIDSRSKLSWEYVGQAMLYRGPRRNGLIDDTGARFHMSLDTKLQDGERQMLTMLGGMVAADYRRYLNTLEGTRVRAMILDYMRGPLQSIPLKPSVHFVPIAHIDELRRFSEAIGTLAGCRIELVPLVDLVEQREHVLAAFQEDNDAALAELVADLYKARSAKVTPKVYAALRHRYDEIMARSEHYAELLDASLDHTTGSSAVAQASLVALSREFIKEDS
jgi:hypothetical protein